MKRLFTVSDIASVAVDCGNGNIITYPTNGGDGDSKVYIFDDCNEFEKYERAHEQYFYNFGNKFDRTTLIGTARFNNAEILYSDCDGIDGGEIIARHRTGEKLSGRYLIYNWAGKVYFVKIED